MLTKKQEKWLSHLSDKNIISIQPYNPKAPIIFKKVKQRIQNVLGKRTQIILRGASSLKISGQGELDIYIPTTANKFNESAAKLTNIFGNPGTVYPKERARFVTYIENIKAEIFVINKASKGWLEGLKFERYLKTHPSKLDAYRKLKEKGNGLSTREYYRHKIEFINDILENI